MLTKVAVRRGVALAVFVAACAHGGYSRLANAPAKPYPCDLAVYATEREVPRRFERLCSISETPAHGVFFDTDSEKTERRESALRTVRQRACRCGADALIMVVPESPRSTIDAVAIRYTSE